MNRLLLLAFLLLPLSGCLTHQGVPSTPPTASPTQAAAPTNAGQAGQNGAQGPSGTPAPNASSALTRKEILSEDFNLNGFGPATPIQVQVPPGAVKVFMALDYQTGIYQNASFTLGNCDHVSPVTGTAVSQNGTTVNMAGSVTMGVLYDCGAISAGEQKITWTLTGMLQGRVKVYADLPI